MQEIALILRICVALVALKAIIGFRFPWETCICCKRKVRDHKEV